MSKKHIIQCVGNRQFHVSKRDDGSYLFELVVESTGAILASPVVTEEEVKKLRDVLDELD